MNIIRIVINNLFGAFSYDLNLKEMDNLAILTGPNGYGKTTILSIINNLYSNNFYFFLKLDFESIELYWEKNYSISISKLSTEKGTSTDNDFTTSDATVKFTFYQKEIIQDEFSFDLPIFKKALTESNVYLHQRSENEWIHRRSDYPDVLEYLEENSNVLKHISYQGLGGNLSLFLNSLNSYFIKDQRLSFIENRQSASKRKEYSITRDARNLATTIKNSQIEALKEAQVLDSTFPKRLLASTDFNG